MEQAGKKQLTTLQARFLTTDGERTVTDYTGPAGAALARAAHKLDAQLVLVVDR